MSRRTALASAMREALSKLKGSHHTREARIRTAEEFASAMFTLGYTHLATPKDIKGKHLKDFVSFRKTQGIQVRTLQNQMSHLRAVLRACGKKDLADAPEVTNKALGISGGSRIGTKLPLSDDQLHRVYELSKAQRRKGIGCMLMLERYLGLRSNEALHARSDTLMRWRRELGETETITVIAGSKGGRPRTVSIKYVDEARAAIDEAIIVASEQHGFLVVRKDGRPTSGLHRARAIYHAWMYRQGVQSHSARYTFAQVNFEAYRKEGYLVREALMRVSSDLGHGSGRGRWIKSVYMRSAKTDIG
jgi:integrase